MRSARSWLVAAVGGAGLVLAGSPPQAKAQAVGFAPVIGSAPEGIAMGVTPVVSADRRYVRLSVGATFSTVDGFQNYTSPSAPWPAGPAPGAGALAGLGAAGGFRSVGVPLGMDGPVGMGNAMTTPPALDAGYASFDDGSPLGDGSWAPAPRRNRATRSKATRSRKATPTANSTATATAQATKAPAARPK